MRSARLIPIGALLLALAGCTAGETASPAPTPPLVDAPALPAVAPVCETELSVPWQEALSEGVLEWDGAPGRVLTVAPDGSLLVRVEVPQVRNELWWHPPDGEPVLVHDLGFEWPNLGASGTATDGRYVAYALTQGNHATAYALYVWDSQGGGAPVPLYEGGPEDPVVLYSPVVHGGQVYWAHRPDGASTATLHRYQVADGANDDLHTGDLGQPERIGELLIWPEWTDRGKEPDYRAIDLATGAPAELPGPLADGAIRVRELAGDTGTLAWTSGSTPERLWVWRADWEEPAQILVDEEESGIGYPSVTTGLVAWQQGRVYLLDQRTGGYAPLTEEEYGSVELFGPWLLLEYPSPDKFQPGEQVLVDTRTLPPLPGCG